MNRIVKTYINGISAFCKNGKFSKEGTYGYLENILFQLKRKQEKQKELLNIIVDEIVGIEELLAKAEAEWALEEEQELAGSEADE